MSNIRESFTTDHRRCDDIFAKAEEAIGKGDWETGEPLAKEFLDAMEHHFSTEEEVLFPMFEERMGPMGPTQVMRMEHGQMRELFKEMAASVEARDTNAYMGQSETLLMLMQQHNAKEEQILYPMTDQALADSADQIVEKLTP